MNEQPAANLQDGWHMARVGDVLKVRNGYAFKSTDYKLDGVPLIRQSDLRGDVVDVAEAKRVDARFLSELPGFVVRDGDLLIGMSGSLGKIARYQHPEPALQNQRTGLLMMKPGHDAKFAKLVLKYVEPQILAEGKGIAVQNVSAKEIEDCIFPLPEPDEQRRIVAEIEKQFTRLDVGVAALRAVQAKLKRYRASVLKAACEGRLVPTEAEVAKAENRKFETGEALLSRILTERRQNWQGRGRYKEPAAPDTSKVAPLPEGWTWASVEHLGNVQLGRQRSPKNVSKNYPTRYIRAANITERGLDVSDVLEMEFSPAERERFCLRNGDIVLSEASGSPSQVGKPAVWRDELPLCCFQNTVLRLRPVAVGSKYALLVFQHFYANSIFANVAGGVGINHLGAEKFSVIPFPLPSLAEQTRIIAEVERRLSVIEELETVVSADLQRATRLRQSILQKAFTGQLTSAVARLADPEPDPYVPGVTVSIPSLSAGAYTLPDAARLLRLPLPRLRDWVRGSAIAEDEDGSTKRHMPAGKLESKGDGRDRHFGFLTLIELYTIGQLRGFGVSMKKLRSARDELEKRYNTPHPFALHGLMTDRKTLLYRLGDAVLLELGKSGQTAFEQVLEQFCHRLDFDDVTKLVTRFYPAGRESSVVVDPRHGFGRPIIAGTNIATEAIASLVRGGESLDDIAASFDLKLQQIVDAWDFEDRLVA